MKRIEILTLTAALALGCGEPRGTGGGSGGGGGSTSYESASGGSGGGGGASSGAGATVGHGGSGGAPGGSGGAPCAPADDGNPCTRESADDAGCLTGRAAEPEGTLCSVQAQYGWCRTGNCLVGDLPPPACASPDAVHLGGGWVAQLVTFSAGVKLAGVAALMPVGQGCAGAARRARLSVPVDPAGPEGESPEGVAVARELTLDASGAWVPAGGLTWVGARADGLLPYPVGSAAWVEVEVPEGGCAAACGDPGFEAGMLCAAGEGPLAGCAPSASWLAAPLGF